ncbi:MAG: glycosyltransferase [Phycisphaerales bacterium]
MTHAFPVTAASAGLGLPLTLSLLILAGLAAACAVYWAVVLGMVVATRLRLPTARDGLALPEATVDAATPEAVCVVVPAHNEEGMIGALARSLRAQDYPNLRFVFALDRCTDGTEAALRQAAGDDPRFEVVLITDCPPDWAGKVHAVHEAVTRAPGTRGAAYLLFADADTRFDPGCVRACLALLKNRQLGLVSLLSTLSRRRWFEHVVQPAAGMELMRQYPPLRVNRRERERARPFANGQFMLFRRDVYDAVGGHAAARAYLLEDIHLAGNVFYHGRAAVGLFLADGMLHCSMYESWPAFRRGWRRIYTEAGSRMPARLEKSAARLLFSGIALPLAAVTAGASGWAVWSATGDPLGLVCLTLAPAALAAMTAGLVAVYRLGRSGLRGVPFYPLAAALVAGILLEAARDLRRGKATKWGGREYVRTRSNAPPTPPP